MIETKPQAKTSANTFPSGSAITATYGKSTIHIFSNRDEHPSKTTLAAMKSIETGEGVATFKSVKDLLADLHDEEE